MAITLKKPPMVSGSKFLLGHALEFNRDRTGLFARGYEEHGKVFQINLGMAKGVVLADPELAKFLYKETDKRLDMAKPMKFMQRALGNVSFLANHENYLLHRPMQMAPFTGKKLQNYVKIMHNVVQKRLDALPDSGELEIAEMANDLVQEVAGRCILGDEIQDNLGKEFWQHYITIGKSLDPITPHYLPLPKFRARDKSRKALAQMLEPVLQERRNNPDKYEDVLQDIVTSKLSDGTSPDDELVMSMVIALLFAGHETTAGQAAWTIIQILQNPWYRTLVEDEIKTERPFLDNNDTKGLLQLKHIKWAVDETTRLRPSADLALRLAEEDIELEGFLIKKDTPVFLAVEKIQTLPEIFDEPKKYDPLRFSPERAEQKRAKHSITGFGGGLHKCVGMGFAIGEMSIFTSLLFQQFDLELITKETNSVSDFGAKRPSVTFIRYKRRNLEKASENQNPEGDKCPYGHG